MSDTRAVAWRWLAVGEYRLRYSVAGTGPAIVLPRKDHAPYVPYSTLAERNTMIQVEPLGFVGSDRPDPYPALSVADQILAVCDVEGIERFAVWGFSQGGAMALTVARDSQRVAAVACGGFNMLRSPSAAWLTRMNREKRVPIGARMFWNDYARSNWPDVLHRLDRPMLAYFGTADSQRIDPTDQKVLESLGVEILVYPDLTHLECGLLNASSPATSAVGAWLHNHDW